MPAFWPPEPSFGVLEGQAVQELAETFRTPDHTPIVVAIGTSTGYLSNIAPEGMVIRGLAVALRDSRTLDDEQRDTAAHITGMAHNNILRRLPAWNACIPPGSEEMVPGIYDWVAEQQEDCADILIYPNPEDLDLLAGNLPILFGLLDRAYRTVRPDGGVVLTAIPRPASGEITLNWKGIKRFSNTDIQEWAAAINGSGIGLRVKYHRDTRPNKYDSLMIVRGADSPTRLPSSEDIPRIQAEREELELIRGERIDPQLLRVQHILEQLREAATEKGIAMGEDELLEEQFSQMFANEPHAPGRSTNRISAERLTGLAQKIDDAANLEAQHPSHDITIPRYHFSVTGTLDGAVLAGQGLELDALTAEKYHIALCFMMNGRILVDITFKSTDFTAYRTGFQRREDLTEEEVDIIEYCLDRFLSPATRRMKRRDSTNRRRGPRF